MTSDPPTRPVLTRSEVGVPRDQAVAAVFLYRIRTTYLPPVWRWMAMVWLRHRSYL